MKLRWCNSPSPSLEAVDSSKDYQGIISFSTPNPTMVESSSPAASVPSLEAISTDGEDSLQLMGEIPANASSQSYSVAVDEHYLGVDSWHAILDEDEDEIVTSGRLSRCSSGILSTESFDMDFEASSLHSLSSAKTLKSPSGRINDDDEHQFHLQGIEERHQHQTVEFARVDTDDHLPGHRAACHGALNINPRQLAQVFAMFSADRNVKPEDKQAQSPEEPAALDKQQEENAPESEPTFVAATCTQEDNPFNTQERFKSRARTAHPKLTAELYWKPRAKSLEKECETLKEILADDSSKILQLKSALETIRMDKLKSLVEIKSLQEQLEPTQKELDTLKKEREVLKENETEYRETIRILKHEVDILTRDDNHKSDEQSSCCQTFTHQSSWSSEELKQLRLENQLFAAQIVDYEAELERLEQQVKSSALHAADKEEEQQSKIALTEDEPVSQGDPPGEAPSDDPDMENKENCPQSQALKDLISKFPYVENVTPSMEEEGIESMSDHTSPSYTEKGKKTRIAIEKVENNGAGEEENAAREEDAASDENCMQDLASGMSTQFPQQILGNVLGMFTVGGSDEGKETDKDEVFVIHEAAAPTSPSGSDKVACLQWRSPDQLPTFVNIDNIIPLEKVEDRNPPSTSSSAGPLSDKTNLERSSMRKILSEHEKLHSGDREETAIEVLHESIEVQLTEPAPDKKTVDSSETCKEKCDLFNALSHCPFSFK